MRQERMGGMMERLALPSAHMRGDRVARFNLLAASALVVCTCLALVLFQLYALRAALQHNLEVQAAMLAPAAVEALRLQDRAAAEQVLAPAWRPALPGCAAARRAAHTAGTAAAPGRCTRTARTRPAG